MSSSVLHFVVSVLDASRVVIVVCSNVLVLVVTDVLSNYNLKSDLLAVFCITQLKMI